METQPWEVLLRGYKAVVTMGEGANCEVVGRDFKEHARLIAAAPELLEDAKDVLDLLCEVAPAYAESTMAANLRATIAKARGQ